MMKHRIGDRVQIKSLDWYNNSEKDYDDSVKCGADSFVVGMKEYCGKIYTVNTVNNEHYLLLDNNNNIIPWGFTDEMIEEKINNMKKVDLESGMVVERRDGVRLLVVDMNGGLTLLGKESYHSGLGAFNTDMTNMLTEEYDIMKVYRVYTTTLNEIFDDSNIIETLYERKEQVELTMQEIADKFNIPVEQLKIKK